MPTIRHISIVAIIVLCAMVFTYQQTHGDEVTEEFAAVPTVISHGFSAIVAGEPNFDALRATSRLLTAVLMHGDFEHILYNMVFLWLFGMLVADHLGQWWALLFFVVTGIAGNVAQVLLNIDSPISILGASGAVCGFEGVYLGLALRWQLPPPDVWPLAHPIPPMQLAAFAVLGAGFDAFKLMNHQQHIAYGAHVGGFIAGLAIAAVVTTLYPTEAAYRRRRV